MIYIACIQILHNLDIYVIKKELIEAPSALHSLVFHLTRQRPTQTNPANFLKWLHQLTTGDHPDPL